MKCSFSEKPCHSLIKTSVIVSGHILENVCHSSQKVVIVSTNPCLQQYRTPLNHYHVSFCHYSLAVEKHANFSVLLAELLSGLLPVLASISSRRLLTDLANAMA